MDVSVVIALWVGITLAWVTAFIVAFTVLYGQGRAGTIHEKELVGVLASDLPYYLSKYQGKGWRLAETGNNRTNTQHIDVRFVRWSLT